MSKRPDAYAQLRHLVLSGQVQPNERLVEADCAKRLHTNRGAIRNAIARLEQEGLVVTTPFRGARVRLVSDSEAIELYEARAALELLVTRPAVEKATLADIRSLEGLLEELRSEAGQEYPLRAGAMARIFRDEVVRISGHHIAIQLVETVNSQLSRYWFRAFLVPGRAMVLVKELEAVLEAIRSGSVERTEQALRTHHRNIFVAVRGAIRGRAPRRRKA